jgi:tetratricopeptide (TPR) repeat protein
MALKNMEKETADDLTKKGIELSNSGNFEEAIKCFAEATNMRPDDAIAFYNWGAALSILAQIRKDDSLFREAFEKYERSTRIRPDYASIYSNWGIALSNLAEVTRDEPFLRKHFEKFRDKSDCFRKLKKDILEILVLFGNAKMKKIIEPEMFYPILDSDSDEGLFFKEATKSIKDKTELARYKKPYILSIFIISLLHVGNKNEKSVAHYCSKNVSQELLLNGKKFRLNAVNYSNDPTEGEMLFDCLYNVKTRPANESRNREYGAFAGCFIFNPDSLNQFRLYGKEDGKEGTGLSLVFQDSFFSKEAKMAIKLLKTEDVNADEKEEKHALFRCIYIDPETRRVETVGHKEEYLFYREKNRRLTAKGIRKEVKDYRKYITDIIANIRKEMEKLKRAIKGLKPEILWQLLTNLRYLTKHIAFREEQECRILKIYRLNDAKVEKDVDFKRMYVEYDLKVSDHIEKIYFGPKATGMELFQDFLTNKLLPIICEKSKNPLA